MPSLWRETAEMPTFGTPDGDVRGDVLVIGGGIAGILCAWYLSLAGIRCVVAEADTVGSGVSGNTTAKVTSQHGLIYARLLRTFGVERARLYREANEAAIAEYRRLCQGREGVLETADSYLFSRTDTRLLEAEQAALRRLGYPAEEVSRVGLPFPVAGALCFREQAMLHPLRLLASLARELTVYEHTPVLELIPGGARTPHGRILAERIVVATHFPFLNKHGSYFLKLYQSRSYVLALAGAPEPGGMYLEAGGQGLSFRMAEGRLLLGGGGHRTGKRGSGWRDLEACARTYYPDADITARWAAQDCMTLDGMPYIGPYAASTGGLYVLTGFNKWGMTSAMAGALLLTEELLGRRSHNASFFSPSRTILRPQLAVNAAEAVLHLLKPTPPRCPHLGCALKWNPQEHSWDCPCHGSRFTENGRLLDGPAQGNLKKSGR